MSAQIQSLEPDEFVTIIGSDMADITRAFCAQGLADRHFAIVHRTGRHHFTRGAGEESEAMFDGQPMIAATFQRCRGA